MCLEGTITALGDLRQLRYFLSFQHVTYQFSVSMSLPVLRYDKNLITISIMIIPILTLKGTKFHSSFVLN